MPTLPTSLPDMPYPAELVRKLKRLDAQLAMTQERLDELEDRFYSHASHLLECGRCKRQASTSDPDFQPWPDGPDDSICPACEANDTEAS